MAEAREYAKKMSDDINSALFVSEGFVFSFGSPILDITANVDEEFLKKYDLPPNTTLVAGPGHEELYDDLINSDFTVDYLAGGSAQNTMRTIGWILGRNNSQCITYFGTVGGDHFGKLMEKQVKSDGVNVMYTKDLAATTGTCAILLTNGGKDRVAIAFLEAASKFKKSVLMRDWFFVDMARMFYLTAHSINISPESVLTIAHHSKKDPMDPKILALNLGGEYVAQKYPDIISQVLPFTDYVFGSELEITSFAKMKEYPNFKTMNIKEIIQMVVTESRKSADHRRVVIVTQGIPIEKILIGRSDSSKTTVINFPPIPEEEFVDRNGMGDAFAGGFLSQLIRDEEADIELCVEVAIHCATHVAKRQGCNFVGDFDYKISGDLDIEPPTPMVTNSAESPFKVGIEA